MKVLVSDSLAQDGLDILKASLDVDVNTGLSEDELVGIIGEYDALVVRSATKVTARVIEAGNRLQVVGRAGVGVDNIDVDAATKRGILVVNAPDGNSIAAAEHAIALMFALARNVPQASASLSEGKWERKQFMGVEVTGKTLGVIGMGRIGRHVARRARGLEMCVIAYDPYVTGDLAEQLGVEMCELDELLAQADFITVHVPKAPSTVGMIGEREFSLVKPSARLINCARGGIVDEGALIKALEAGQLAGAALDVFSAEPPPPDSPLLGHPKVVATPHLGASTQEAQVAVAYDVARQVVDILAGRPATFPVNAPIIPPETQAQLLPFCELAEKLGQAARQLAEMHIDQVRFSYAGQLADMDTDLLRALLIKGLFGITEPRITLVNASMVAREHGLRVVEEKTEDATPFANLITISFQEGDEERVLSGTIMRGEPFIVCIDQYWMDIVMQGYQLLAFHRDRPGLIGEVGQVTGRHDINIAFMGVGRLEPRGEALMALTLDEPASAEVQAEIEALKDIYRVRMLEL
ncbi:MAG: phosphoglycerate dehydrogenase [Anaerolineae bacterium]|nr:phosphoglycerate dehydrogenase [Anaerolineae bacterium]